MAQQLVVLQSLWAMERRHTDGVERSLEQNLAMILEAGFDGVSMTCLDPAAARRTAAVLKPQGKVMEVQCFPKSVDDLKPVLELCTELGVYYLDIQADVRPRRIAECIPLLEGWRRLAEQVRFPVYFETHRDRMTTDLYFTLDLLECFPDLKLLGDLSHFLVGREFAMPISAENQAYMQRIIDHCWAFQGRVASREQVQVEISFPHNRMWMDLFLSWWEYGFRSWSGRAKSGESLAFVCELGPKPYAIAGPDGNDAVSDLISGQPCLPLGVRVHVGAVVVKQVALNIGLAGLAQKRYTVRRQPPNHRERGGILRRCFEAEGAAAVERPITARMMSAVSVSSPAALR